MKPYLAKYLPVEGEIKEGDRCTALYNDCIVQLSKNEIPWPNSKKVKLFLCSRDIQVGDKVISKFGGWKEKIAVEKDGIIGWISESTKAHLYFSPDDYKIIGEISPEATWVKEGDEFDEEQIRWKTWNKYDYSLIPLNKIEWEHWNPEGAIFAVIGPCGRFH